jgi:uncharacterized SAM-dependent methyltransferase
MPPASAAVLDVRVDILVAPEQWAAELRRETRDGLTSTPKRLSPTWLYDDAGCVLFDRITRLPEYYLTRRERAILARHATDIAGLSDADTLVEIGHDGSGFAFDNGSPRHEVLLRPYELAPSLVTNTDWLAFMTDANIF